MRALTITFLIALTGSGALAHEQPPPGCAWWHGGFLWPRVQGCCPDDYCPKQVPGAEPAPPGQCCDYKAKQEPTPPERAPQGCCDDYCGKKIPCVTPPPPGTCGPPEESPCPRKQHPWLHWLGIR